MNPVPSYQTVCLECGSVNRVGHDRPAAAARCGRCAKSLGLDEASELDDLQLSRLLERSQGLVLLDVWAPWCGPCRAMAPNFASAARALAGEARLVKLNADTSQMVHRLGVSGIPALLLFRDGRIIDRKAGLMSAQTLAQWVRGHSSAAAVS
jgi:thioredoxin 2